MGIIKIAVIGTGYVGLVSGACLSEFGFKVICMDVDHGKIERLCRGEIPIYEPGLDDIVKKGIDEGRLCFTTDYVQAMDNCDVVFIAVGTPPLEDGSADLQYVLSAAESIAAYMKKYTVIVNKSTVPVGSGELVRRTVLEVLERRGVDIPFDVVSNPEFLREGSAVRDFMQPDRIVIGVESESAQDVMRQVYRVLYVNNSPFIFCDIKTAELIKYASNAYLAARITFVNELSILCETVGADVTMVSQAMGKDSRIGSRYLQAGAGYGGSCFPKDTRALFHMGQGYGVELSIVGAVIEANERQKLYMVEKILKAMGTVEGRSVCVLGLAFKPETDDIRDAPSLTIIRELIRRGAKVVAYDPISMENAQTGALSDLNIRYAINEVEAIKGAEALVIVTEWNRFRNLNMYAALASMTGNFLFDLRNIYSRAEMEGIGFEYHGVGR